MKNYLISLVLIFSFSAFGAITVMSPNGGETISTGNPYEVIWDDNSPKDIRIELFQNDVYHSDIVLATASDGSFIWNIPKGVPGENYQVKITSVINPTQFDFSDGYFTMTLDDSINVTSPSGGESLLRGGQFDILWDDNISENVQIELFQNDVFHSEITLSTPSDGTYTWDIPEDTYGANYQIKISSIEIPLATNDLSTGYFDILTGSVIVLTPNGGEDLTRGNQYEITWTDDIPEDVKIELYQNDVFIADIISSTPSVGSYLWNVPNDLYGSNYQINIVSNTFPAIINDISDSYFNINPGEISVTYPNGGEAFDRGDPLNISWTDNISENVKIELLENDIYLMDIVTSTESDGSYVWNIPIDLSGTYTIKITSIDYDVINDSSDSSFDILIGAVSVLSPNGGEVITRDSQYEITWIDNITEQVKIELYQNDTYHSDIFSSTTSDGSYMWNIASDLSGSNFQIKISSVTIPLLISDMSDGYFTISEGVINVLTPNGGEVLTRGDEVNISWSDNIPENVKIELFENDVYLMDIVASTESDGSYLWTTPINIAGDFKVQVVSTSHMNVSDTSDSIFSILPGEIIVLTPNSAETIERESQYEITWTNDIAEDVKIELYQNDSYHSDIISSIVNDSTYTWNIPSDVNGSNFQVKIISLALPMIAYDLSDNYFSISAGIITILTPSTDENLVRGSIYDITWEDDIPEFVRIELFENDTYHSTIIDSTESDGLYLWSVPVDIYGVFKIKIVSTEDLSVFDQSDSGFDILTGRVRVLLPGDGEDLYQGTQYEITWTNDILEDVKIELYQNDVYHSDIVLATASDGSYIWDIPTDITGLNFQIRISSSIIPDLAYDVSTGYFTISDATKVIDPNGGESLISGDLYNIVWTDIMSEDVKIELYQDDTFHSMIADSTSSDGLFEWYIPYGLQGFNYKVKISSVTSPDTYTDISDGNFQIISGTIVITSPQAGETLEMMDDYLIEWTDDIYEDVVISLYKSATLIAMINAPSNGSYMWDFYTGDISAGSDYRLKIESKVANSIYDETGLFTMKGTNNVNGSVHEVWTEPNSPYILIDNTFVLPENSLLIEPQVKVKGAPSHLNFDIRGKMEALGEINNEIKFKNINLSYNNSTHPDTSKVTYTVFDRDYKNNLFADNKPFGGASDDICNSVRQTLDGGYIIVGTTNSFGAGGSDVWVIKTDKYGMKEWDKTYGGVENDFGNSIIQTQDGGYIIAGATYSYGAGKDDVWLIKTDSFGNVIWNKTFGNSASDHGFSVEQTDDNGFVITGITYSYSPGSSDFWLIKTDPNGNMEWNNYFGAAYENEYSYSVKQTSDNGYIMAGKTNTLANGYDVWLLKTDSNGNEVWNNSFGGSSEDYGYSVKETRDGGYIITGGTISFAGGTYGIWLIKTDANGDEVWNKVISGSYADKSYEVQETIDGGFIVAGHTLSYGAGANDVWLIKTDSNGNELWDKTIGGPNDDYAYSVEQTTDGGYVIAGTTSSYGAGGLDVWLMKTDSYGNNIYGNAIIAVNDNSKLVMQNSIISNFNDYGLFINNSSPIISSNLITNNKGGIKFTTSSPQFIINNTIVENDSICLYFDGDSDAQLYNNIIYGNGAEEVYINNNDSDPLFMYNNIEGGSSSFGLNAGVIFTGAYENNIDTDPLFELGTYNLQASSPCRDAGDQNITQEDLETIYSDFLPSTDILGNPRFSGDYLDMGAYEYYVVVDTPESPTNVVVSTVSNILTLDWDNMPNANSYLIYSSDDPYGAFQYLQTVSTNTWNISIDVETKKFYYIVSSTETKKVIDKKQVIENIRR